MKRIEIIALAVFSLLISTMSIGQAPSDELDLLAMSSIQNTTMAAEYPAETTVDWEKMIGEWEMSIEYFGASGTVLRKEKGIWKIFKAMDGPVIREIAEVTMSSGDSFQFVGYFIFDESTNTCQRVTIDSFNKKLEVLEGISNKDKIILNTSENGEEFRQTFYNVSTDGFEWKQEKLDKHTGTWSVGVHSKMKKRSN